MFVTVGVFVGVSVGVTVGVPVGVDVKVGVGVGEGMISVKLQSWIPVPPGSPAPEIVKDVIGVLGVISK